MEKDLAPKVEKHKKIDKKKAVLIIAIVIVILGLIGGSLAAYRSHNSVKKQRDQLSGQVKDLQTQNKKLESQKKELTGSLGDANKQLKKLYDDAKNAKAKDTPLAKAAALTASVTGVTGDSRGYVHQSNTNVQVIIIDLTVKNESTSDLYLSLSDFKLKDSDDHTYNADLSSCWPPAANKVLLKAQSLAPGESVSGSICYANMSVFLTGLNLHYGDQAFDIVPKDATYPTWQ